MGGSDSVMLGGYVLERVDRLGVLKRPVASGDIPTQNQSNETDQQSTLKALFMAQQKRDANHEDRGTQSGNDRLLR